MAVAKMAEGLGDCQPGRPAVGCPVQRQVSFHLNDSLDSKTISVGLTRNAIESREHRFIRDAESFYIDK